jgi:hypothetical protein
LFCSGPVRGGSPDIGVYTAQEELHIIYLYTYWLRAGFTNPGVTRTQSPTTSAEPLPVTIAEPLPAARTQPVPLVFCAIPVRGCGGPDIGVYAPREELHAWFHDPPNRDEENTVEYYVGLQEVFRLHEKCHTD